MSETTFTASQNEDNVDKYIRYMVGIGLVIIVIMLIYFASRGITIW